MGKETNPRAAFERLFSSGNSSAASGSLAKRQALKKSILDFVSEDAKKLQTKLGGNDNKKLDEYLTGVRDIEQRLQRLEGSRVVTVVPDDNARILQLQGGELDAMKDVPFSRVPELQMDANLKVYQFPSTRTDYITLNTRNAPLETATDGYTLVNTSLDWHPIEDKPELKLGIAANNIFDVVARRHSSLLKDYAPLAGRDIRLTASFGF